MPRTPMIRVYPNPFSAIDHEGRPCGRVMLDPVDHHAYAADHEPRRYVGAAIDNEKTVVFQKSAKGSAQADLQETFWSFSEDVVELPRTHYYLERIRANELFAADEDTAEHAGIALVPYEKQLAAAKASALALLTAERPNRALPEWAESATVAPKPALVRIGDATKASSASATSTDEAK